MRLPVPELGRRRSKEVTLVLWDHSIGPCHPQSRAPAPGRWRSTLLSPFAFNLGIETGQRTLVLASMPVVYTARARVFYRHRVLPWGSAGIASLALVWFVQRAFVPTG